MPLIHGVTAPPPERTGLVVIGSGLSGASASYWLAGFGLGDVTMLDWRPEDAATNRNCGHILYGTVESALALTALKGARLAAQVLELSVGFCHQLRDTGAALGGVCEVFSRAAAG